MKPKLHKIITNLKAVFFSSNLNKLAEIYQTDKWGSHFYTPHYMQHFKKFRFKKINLLEIGVGGYANIYEGGNSLRMWKKYFPFSRIFSIDIYDKSFINEKYINVFQGSQVDERFMDEVIAKIGIIDIIIDDGSHINEHVIKTFKHLFPKLKDGGIYVIEDTQTSYWEDYGGDSKNLNNPKTTMGFFKSMTDTLNNQEIINPNYKQSYFDKKIISMHFYHNLIFIYKGNNDEKSNIINN